MKNFFWILSLVSVSLLYSCKEKNKTVSSFSELIKENPGRKAELLRVADALRLVDTPKYKLSAELKDSMRAKKEKLTVDSSTPQILMSLKDINDIVTSNGGSMDSIVDSLVFSIGLYRNENQIQNYKTRPNQQDVTFDKLKRSPTLIVELKTLSKNRHLNLFAISPAYDPGRLCPPPLLCNAYQ